MSTSDAAQLFTSESVSMGHPDKVADQISDAVLDAMLKQDPASRVACETMVSTGMAVVAGEVTTNAYVEISDIVRETIERIGYTDGDMRFDAKSCSVLVSLKTQAAEIAEGVDREGAGDQGMMFGYACKESESLAPGTYMPLPLHLSHRLVERQAHARVNNLIPGLRPDAKSPVTLEYAAAGNPTRVTTVVRAPQHAAQRSGSGPTPGPPWTCRSSTRTRLARSASPHVVARGRGQGRQDGDGGFAAAVTESEAAAKAARADRAAWAFAARAARAARVARARAPMAARTVSTRAP